MFNIIPGPIRGVISLILYGLNTLFWCVPLFIMVVLKALIPLVSWRRRCSHILNAIAENWIGCNNLNQKITGSTCWDVQGLDALHRSGWYLVLANHQSWADIMVLQRVFHRKIPFLKFFIKKELIWFPMLGQAWWAMEFPFVKRYGKSFLKRNPHLMGKDLETTRKACLKFQENPVSIMNFVEGTRFTDEKHRCQQSPYTNLLKTKAGGIALVLDAMGEQINRILDVTIVYPKGARSFWDFVCGNIRTISVRVKSIPVTPELSGDYTNDQQYRVRFQRWLNQLWEEKDFQIEMIYQGGEIDRVHLRSCRS